MFGIRQNAVCVAILLILVSPAAVWSQSTLNFPRAFSPSELGLTGFAVVNPGPAAAQVTYQLYDAGGQVAATSTLTIPARGQSAKLGLGPSELFQQAPAGGWVQATSSTAGLQGFWLGGDFTTFADGAAAAGSATELIFPLVSPQTEINVVNPGTSAVTLTLRLFGADGAEIASAATQSLTGRGFLQRQVSSLFPAANLAQATHVRASCTGQCAGTAVLSNYLVSPSRGVINGISAASTATDANFPHVVSGAGAGGSYATVVGVANLTSNAQIITLTFTPASGSPQSVTRTLPGNGAIRDSVQNLFGFSANSFNEGWVKVVGSAPLTAFAAFADTVRGGLAVVPVQETPAATMLFAHIADLAPWATGLALLNTGATDAVVEVYAMTPAGTLIGGADNVTTARFTLRTGSKRSALLSELIPHTQQRSSDGGFVFIRSSVPLYGMELFFTRDLAILSNVAPSAIAQGITFTPPSPPPIQINEVESNGGTPGDWVEIINNGAAPVDISGWRFLDNDDTHTAYILPSGSTIAAGGYLLLEEAAFGFGLGAPDSVRLYDATGALYQTYSWTAHAATTYGRCPNGTGIFTTTSSSTKGAANACGTAAVTTVHINEVESNGGTPGDWVELVNTGAASVDISGWRFLDNDDTHAAYTLPAGSTIAAGGYLVLEEAAFGFGLGAPDSVRLYDATGTLYESYSWTDHAATTYGRCPSGSGAFTTTSSSTKGAANACPGEVTVLPWAGDAEVQTVDGLNVFGGNLSGLMYEGSGSATPGVLWAVRNGPGSLFRLVWNGTIWAPDTSNNWSAGKLLLYPGGGGSPDAEGVTFADVNSGSGMYVSTERDNNANAISRNSILRFDASAAGATLTATHEWNLTADLPVVGANLGIEAITWVPDTFLTSRSFFDESKGRAYNPADYANHGSGLFFVGVEANGMIYAYALDHTGGGFTRVATIASGFTGVMDLRFDRETNDLWAVCDDTCQGQSVILRIDATGRFRRQIVYDRPGMMPNLNNEGFAVAPLSECAGNRRPVFWADDSETGGHAIRRGSLACTQATSISMVKR